jgi:hypothetical protein
MAEAKLNNLVNNMAKKSNDEVQSSLKSNEPENRFAAAVVVGDKKLPYGDDLVELLNDPDPLVTQAARRSLIVLSYHVDAAKKAKFKGFAPKAVDYGPQPGAGKVAKSNSVKNWKNFLSKNEKILSSLNDVAPESSTSPKSK